MKMFQLTMEPGHLGQARSGIPRFANLEPIVRCDHRGPFLQFISAKGFEWTEAHIPIPNLPDELDGFRILHITDIHARRRWDPAYDDLIGRVLADPPDLIAYTGDFVEDKHDHRKVFPIVR